MKLNKYKLGDLIKQSYVKNANLSFSDDSVRGISINKVLIPTKADMTGVPLMNYLLIKPNYFTYVPVTSRNGEKISICFNDTNNTYICSSTYVCFYVERTDILDPKYLFMYFNRPEFDRYARFNSWGSAREIFDWSEMCNINIELPPLEVQKKYVAIYDAIKENQKTYEERLDNLKLVCYGYIDKLKRRTTSLKGYIEQINRKNEELNGNVVGISKQGFIKPKVDSGELRNYNVITYNDFVYNPPRINIGSIELYKEQKEAVCSPIYIIFKVKDENILNSDYLNIWLHRSEFFRSTEFYSVATVRNNFSFDLMEETRIAIPPIDIQKSIATIYNLTNKCKMINDKLKKELSKLCPILIKGSVEEGQDT